MAKKPETFESRTAEAVGRCTCAGLRRATRTITQIFDAALQPSGLKTTQFTLLVTLAQAGKVPLTRLADTLVMDRTTLTRNLQPLEDRNLIRIRPGQDRRSREISLTDKGKRAVDKAYPLWSAAQGKVVRSLGRQRWKDLMGDLDAVVELAD